PTYWPPRSPTSPLFPYTTLFRSPEGARDGAVPGDRRSARAQARSPLRWPAPARRHGPSDRARAAGFPHGRAALEPGRQAPYPDRSEEHTSELQSLAYLVCRLLLE